MNVLEFHSEFEEQGEKPLFQEILVATNKKLRPDSDLSLEIGLISDEEMLALNSQYRNKDSSTDVLSFSMPRETKEGIHLGQIFISPVIAERQARELQHTYLYEMCFLFSHGLLHLMAWDHQTEETDKEMKAMSYLIIEPIISKNS